jgi:molybdopterin-guanine dinucleotide biosynthesis protein A
MPSAIPSETEVTAGAQVTAWLLAGGASRRMGRDKALLLHQGDPLLLNRRKLLQQTCREVHVLAPVERYAAWGIKGTADLRPGCGPLGAIETALLLSRTDWNLIFACDLPHVTLDWLRQLLSAPRENFDCIASTCISNSAGGGEEVQPLCALWQKSALPFVASSLNAGNFRVRDVLADLRLQLLSCPHPGMLANWNEPADCGL